MSVEVVSVDKLVALADELLNQFLIELAANEIRLETYNDKEETVVGLAPFQKDLYLAIVRAGIQGNEELATLITRQAGKTESVILAIIALCIIHLSFLKQSYAVGIFAPARSQAIEVDRERLRDRVAQLTDLLKANGIRHDATIGKTTKNFYLYSGSHTFRCRMESADPEANIKGSTLNLLLFEQPEDMDESKMKNDIFPMGAAVRGSRIFNGTPTTGVNNPYFYNLCVRKKPALQVDWKEAGKWRPGYLETVLRQREDMGEDDPAFRAQYGLEWIPGLAKFTTPEDVEAHQMGYVPDFVYRRRSLGVDWAKEQDDTAGAVWEQCNDPNHKDRTGQICNHLHLLALHEEHGVNYPEQTDRLTEFAKFWKVTRTCDDATGVGDPNNDYLTQKLRGISEVEGLTLTTVTNDNTSNLFAREYNQKRLWIPKPETFDKPPYTTLLNEQERTVQKRLLKKFITQVCDLEREYSAGSKLNLHHPEGSSYHDDFPKACILGVYASVRLATSPPSAAYATIDTRPPQTVNNEQERFKEIVKQQQRPFQSWGEI